MGNLRCPGTLYRQVLQQNPGARSDFCIGLCLIAASHYGTALHETAHWTGAPQRLNRETLNNSRGFGDIEYAKEELRAELASVFLMAERGIPHNPGSHAAWPALFMKLLLRRRIRACLRWAQSDSSTYWSRPAPSLQDRLRNPPFARLAATPVCTASRRTIMNNAG